MANFVKLLSSGFFQTINADALARIPSFYFFNISLILYCFNTNQYLFKIIENPPVGVVQIASLKQIKIENGVRNRFVHN